MNNPTTPAPDKWAAYTGVDGATHYVSLVEVVGVKFPDPVTKGVTLRLSNGQFVPVTDSIGRVLADLNAI